MKGVLVFTPAAKLVATRRRVPVAELAELRVLRQRFRALLRGRFVAPVRTTTR